jgi:hypothetical protein
LGAVLVTLLVAALVGTAALTRQDDSSTTTTTVPPSLSGTARELFDLLRAKDSVTYHARYEGSSPEVAALALETWQLPPNVRQDSDLTVSGQRAQTSSFLLDSTQVRCVRLAVQGAWTCQPGGTADIDPLASIRERLDEVEVTARDTTIGDRAVRCFQFTVDGATNELCLIPEKGIPVLVRASGSELNLIVLDEDVTEDDFVPPAEVTGG